MEEKTSLLSASAEPKSFYFINRSDRAKSTVNEEEVEIENSANSAARRQSFAIGPEERKNEDGQFAWFRDISSIFTNFTTRRPGAAYQTISENKPRKVPVKIEPKVFFANERTFLAWLHMSVNLASISIAILAFAEANQFSQMYGLLLMPVAIAFCIYSLWMFMKRAAMIKRKDPGPYEDKAGPIALSLLLAFAILANFLIKLYDYSR